MKRRSMLMMAIKEHIARAEIASTADLRKESAHVTTQFGTRVHQRFAALESADLPLLERVEPPRAAKLPE